MRLIAITNLPSSIIDYQRIGVDRILIDLERIGKAERQAGWSAWISDHTPDDVSRARRMLSTTSLMVRINPLHANSASEIDDVIRRGADVVMLPMARNARDAICFVNLVDGRVKTSLLVETASALAEIDAIAEIPRLDEVHFGLNDLHMTLGLRSMFQILSEGLLDHAARTLLGCNKAFGIGGVGALGSGPVDPKLILIEHLRLGSTAVILSRSFFKGIGEYSAADARRVLGERVADLRAYVESLRRLSNELLQENRDALGRNIAAYLATIA